MTTLFIFLLFWESLPAENVLPYSGCHRNEFRCLNKKSCISRADLCDGTKHCQDGSDEIYAVCAPLFNRCPSSYYQCSYGGCVKNFTQCQDKIKCSISYSPNSCAQCGNFRFACSNQKCVSADVLCDGFPDCTDGSDETIQICGSKVCEKGEFKCKYGACIRASRRCDQIKDCADGSDEDVSDCKFNSILHLVPASAPQPFFNASSLFHRPSSKAGCVVPRKPEGGDHKIDRCEGSECFIRPGDIVGALTKLNFVCSKGYQLSEKYSNSYCSAPSYTWDPEPPSCLRTCPSLASESLDLECYHQGKNVPCDGTILPSTTLRARCKNAYYLADPSATFNETYCLSDGNWEKQLFQCNINCGRPFVVGAEATIAGGTKSQIGQFPWHAGLYFKTPTGFVKPGCGGSLITPYIVLTAAHCVFSPATKIPRAPETIKVALGKYWSDWDHPEEHEQKRDVNEIVPHENYEGQEHKYLFDIALISLKQSTILSDVVHPICIDWLRHHDPKQGEMGVVSGWGATLTSDTTSEELLYAHLKYIEYRTCRERVSTVYISYVTIDKFCTQNDQGQNSGVLHGDSGGGWSLDRGGRYYLYGVVSHKPNTNQTQDERFAGFTSVVYHLHWIETIKSQINEKRRYSRKSHFTS